MPRTKHTTKTGDEEMPTWVAAMKQDIIETLKNELKQMVDDATERIADRINAQLEQSVSIAVKKATGALVETIDSQQLEIQTLRNRCQDTDNRMLKLESYSMRENLIISGVMENDNETEEDLRKSLDDLFDELELDPDNISINRCHRISSRGTNKTVRDIIVRFTNLGDKQRILRSSHHLKGRDSPIYINEQFPREIELRRRVLRPVMQKAKALHKKCSLIQDKLILGGKAYYVDTLRYVPFDITDLSTAFPPAYPRCRQSAEGGRRP